MVGDEAEAGLLHAQSTFMIEVFGQHHIARPEPRHRAIPDLDFRSP